jgi:transcriptional regulator with XRE-family HTH domain
LTKREFAKRCHVDSRRITDWETSGQPDASNLRQIGEAFAVSVDWLVGLIGSDDAPMYRGQSGDLAELEGDVVAHVKREIHFRAQPTEWPEDLCDELRVQTPIDAKAVLAAATEHAFAPILDARQKAELYVTTLQELTDDIPAERRRQVFRHLMARIVSE